MINYGSHWTDKHSITIVNDIFRESFLQSFIKCDDCVSVHKSKGIICDKKREKRVKSDARNGRRRIVGCSDKSVG